MTQQIIMAIYPKITFELPEGDNRIINQWWIDSRDDGYHVCISVDDPINIPEVYQPEIWQIKKDLVYKLIPCLQTGLENTQSTLAEHDSSLGRTTTKNRMWAETLEQEIRDIEDCIKQLRLMNASNSTHYP